MCELIHYYKIESVQKLIIDLNYRLFEFKKKQGDIVIID